ncbi:hypothetical protein BDZ97DRAFT_1781032 [Flammula alnicola]|nr:hypothetical protein BDZ97DRAFT_1781032 [Flammula alnicola]
MSPHTSGLLSLSPELILEISSHIISWRKLRSAMRDPNSLDRPDMHKYNVTPCANGVSMAWRNVGNMRLACRSLNEILEHIIFTEVVFDFHITRPSTLEVESQLASFSRTTSPACKYAKFLRITCLNPVEEGYASDGRYFRRSSLDDAMQARAAGVLQSIDAYLEKAVFSFQNLQCVAWDIKTNNGKTVSTMGALSTLPFLEDLTLRIGPDCEPLRQLRLNRFSGLRSLAVSLTSYAIQGYNHQDNEFVDHLAQVIAHSPLLSHLDVVESPDKVHDFSFHNLTKKVPANRPLVHLKELRLSRLGPYVRRHNNPSFETAHLAPRPRAGSF